jgi:hypothetical protein
MIASLVCATSRTSCSRVREEATGGAEAVEPTGAATATIVGVSVRGFAYMNSVPVADAATMHRRL